MPHQIKIAGQKLTFRSARQKLLHYDGSATVEEEAGRALALLNLALSDLAVGDLAPSDLAENNEKKYSYRKKLSLHDRGSVALDNYIRPQTSK